MAAPGLERHRLALLAAKEDVGNPRAGTNWAVFAYDKHNDLKLLDSGAGGPDELAGKFSTTSIMYGLCRVQDPSTGAHRIVLINWVGERTPEPQREAYAGHLPTIRAFFRPPRDLAGSYIWIRRHIRIWHPHLDAAPHLEHEASVVLSARHAEEVTQEGLSRVLAKLAPSAAPTLARRMPPSDAQELVGTNYRKTNPALEIRRTKRDSFWAQAEREEEQRKEEERRRALEERRRWERERMEEEKREAAERELRCMEKERMIEAQRKEQARLEAEERRKEKARWEQQQREHEEAMRDRSRHSESIEKAAEAAALVSLRSQNPRDFFRQRERSGSTSSTPPPASPLCTRPGARRPFLRYQRSLTESAFIFRRPDPPPVSGPLHHGPFGAAPPRPQPPTPTRPVETGTPPATSPIGMGSCAGTGSTPSPVGMGGPPLAGLIEPSPPPPRATWGSPGLAGQGVGPLPPISEPEPLPSPSSSKAGCPPGPPGSGSPDSTCRAEPLPSPSTLGLAAPSSPPQQPTLGTEEAAVLPPPSPPPVEDGPLPDTSPLPSPPAWESPGPLVGLGEGVPNLGGSSPPPGLVPAQMPRARTPPRSPSPPSLTQDPALPCLAAWEPQPGPVGQSGPEPAQSDLGHNGIGDHKQGGWPDPWEQDLHLGQGDEPGAAILPPQPLHKATPGFALLLARDAPHPQLPGGTSPPAEDEDRSPHAV